MFSFHRPKVYRSSTGCCICKAKSSSSRFTISKKYEEDFLECFKLSSPRQGEICNACVLLVKRWKKLPAGSERNWQHVVDARAGPGMKSFTKFKSKNKKCTVDEKMDKIKKKKRFDREFSPESDANDEMELDFLSEEVPSMGSSRTASPGVSDTEEAVVEKSRRHKAQAKRRDVSYQVSGFVDLDYWKKETMCCGTIFRGLNGEIMVDPCYLKPCSYRLAKCKARCEIVASPKQNGDQEQSDGGATKVYSDSSSDSGYDESSNPENAFKKDQVSIEVEYGVGETHGRN